MIVVSDTSPITNLIQIGKLGLLQKIYTTVFIPPEVYKELSFLDFQKNILEAQNWIIKKELLNPAPLDDLAMKVDRGEAEAIILALELKAHFLLIDEQTGRKVAEDYGLKITGVLGVLVQAKKLGLIPEIKNSMERLRDEANFRIHPKLFNTILEMAGEQ